MKNINPLAVRLPAELKIKIDEAAARNKRSKNAEMVARLEESFRLRPLEGYADGDLVAELMRRYKRGDIAIRVGHPDAPVKKR